MSLSNAPPSAKSTFMLVGLRTLWCTGVMSFGCSSSFDFKDAGSDTAALSDTDESEPADTGDTGSLQPIVIDEGRWGLVGTLVITDGLPDAGASSLQLELQANANTCTWALTILTAAVQEAPPEPAIAWWTLSFELAPSACTWAGPTTFDLAFVDPGTSLDSAAIPAGLRTDTPYGVIIDVGGDPRLVGLAGTSEQFEGTDKREPSVSNGSYVIETLFGLVLP